MSMREAATRAASAPSPGLGLVGLVGLVGIIGLLCIAEAPAAAAQERYGLGSPLTAEVLAGWDIDIASDGKGLPAGQGSVADGKVVYEARCASCHGSKGEGKPANRLVGGSVKPPAAVKTIGSYWPYATTLYDYINRAMPWDRPQSLTADEVYAVSAYILHLNGILPDSAVLDAQSLPKVRMPNREGFTSPDPRPDTK